MLQGSTKPSPEQVPFLFSLKLHVTNRVLRLGNIVFEVKTSHDNTFHNKIREILAFLFLLQNAPESPEKLPEIQRSIGLKHGNFVLCYALFLFKFYACFLCRHVVQSVESQTRSSKEVQGALHQPFINPSPTLANLSSSLCQPFLPTPLPSSSWSGPQSPVQQTNVFLSGQKLTQTKSFWSEYFRVGCGSST